MLDNSVEGVMEYTFSDTTSYFGETQVHDLTENGRNIAVTDANKFEYVNLITAHRMTNAVKDQLAALVKGFEEVVPRETISILNASELELLISGTPDIDVEDLRANTEDTGFTVGSKQIQWFWDVVREMNKEDLARLLMFCTGTSKVPLDGFGALQGMQGPQRFQIHRQHADDSKLPSAHTCFNQLDLHEYSSKQILRDRLLYAIVEGCEGFGFI
jgi:E3 ubiquitin-protein ligase HUWE1